MAHPKSSFDALLDEIIEGDRRRAQHLVGRSSSARESAEDDELHPTDLAIYRILRKLSDVVVAQAQSLKDTQAEVKALKAEVDALKGGRGKPMHKALRTAGLSGEEFLTKALAAQAAGRITGTQVATAEACINAGKTPPADLLQAVLEAA